MDGEKTGPMDGSGREQDIPVLLDEARLSEQLGVSSVPELAKRVLDECEDTDMISRDRLLAKALGGLVASSELKEALQTAFTADPTVHPLYARGSPYLYLVARSPDSQDQYRVVQSVLKGIFEEAMGQYALEAEQGLTQMPYATLSFSELFKKGIAAVTAQGLAWTPGTNNILYHLATSTRGVTYQDKVLHIRPPRRRNSSAPTYLLDRQSSRSMETLEPEVLQLSEAEIADGLVRLCGSRLLVSPSEIVDRISLPGNNSMPFKKRMDILNALAQHPDVEVIEGKKGVTGYKIVATEAAAQQYAQWHGVFSDFLNAQRSVGHKVVFPLDSLARMAKEWAESRRIVWNADTYNFLTMLCRTGTDNRLSFTESKSRTEVRVILHPSTVRSATEKFMLLSDEQASGADLEAEQKVTLDTIESWLIETYLDEYVETITLTKLLGHAQDRSRQHTGNELTPKEVQYLTARLERNIRLNRLNQDVFKVIPESQEAEQKKQTGGTDRRRRQVRRNRLGIIVTEQTNGSHGRGHGK